ncbi:hypothetical protein BGZ94_009798, partial [Podila epigama]
MSQRKSTHRSRAAVLRGPRCQLSLAICLALTIGPSTFAPLSASSSLSSVSPVCDGAPALWSPIVDALEKPGGFLGALFNKNSAEEESNTSSPPEVGGVTIETLNKDHLDNDKATQPPSTPASFSDEVVATAEDYGVVHLDLEGDPNCDYTTKVKIAGNEYNVIIDTGSAHFAVASDACHDCIIPLKNNDRGNAEEEIPIDEDPLLKVDAPLFLFKASLHPTNINTTTSPMTSSSLTDSVATSALPTGTMTTINSPSTISTPPSSMTPRPDPAQAALRLDHKNNFSSIKHGLEKMKSVVENVNKTVSASTVAPHPTHPVVPVRASRDSGPGKNLAAAPAENLYTLPESARQSGEPIRVSYGIKSHSVGWSGVMTSDLLTLEMAKVRGPQSEGQAGQGKMRLEAGGIMEKETNVEFAAITENNAFFSQECGAQHGIWGLGYRTLSVDQKPTLLDTLSATMKIPNGFALQLCGRASNTTKTGNMFLGGYSNAHLAEPMQYVPLVKKDWYQVQLDGFRVMGVPVTGMQNLNVPKTIVDSGTTNILMSHYNLQFLIQALAHSD